MGLDLLRVQCALVAKGCGLCNVCGDGLCCRFDDCHKCGEGVRAMIIRGDTVVVVVAGNERRGDGCGPVLCSGWWWRTDCHPAVGSLPRHSPRIPGGRLHLRRPPGRPAGPAEPPRGLPIRITIVGIGAGLRFMVTECAPAEPLGVTEGLGVGGSREKTTVQRMWFDQMQQTKPFNHMPPKYFDPTLCRSTPGTPPGTSSPLGPGVGGEHPVRDWGGARAAGLRGYARPPPPWGRMEASY